MDRIAVTFKRYLNQNMPPPPSTHGLIIQENQKVIFYQFRQIVVYKTDQDLLLLGCWKICLYNKRK